MKRAFAVAAHPDDIEFFMSGTLMRLAAVGYELHYMNVADGCCGSMQHDAETIAAIRLEEAKNAAARIDAVFHGPLVHDLEIFYDRETLARLAAIVRQVAPEIMLIHAPADYMEDHMNACRLAVTAAFARGAPNFPVEPPTPAVNKPVTLYHAQPYGNRDPLGEPVRPNTFVDVSELQDRKCDMLAEHKSQRDWLDESQGVGSYLVKLQELDREVGQMSGRFEYAEGWRRHNHLGFCGPDDDPLVAALGECVFCGDF